MKSIICILCFASLPNPLHAQLGELQMGVLAAYGTAPAYGPGAGLAFGIAPARLAYVGLRWTYYFGVTEHLNGTTTEVLTKAQVIGADLGVEIPLGKLEVYPIISLGWNQFTQHSSPPTSSGSSSEFFGAPGLAVEARLSHFAVIPEFHYLWAGKPEIPWAVEHEALVVSVRLVVLGEVRRIRR